MSAYRPPTVTSAAPLQFLILLVASWVAATEDPDHLGRQGDNIARSV
jgi:hypothetical protein